MGEEGVGLATEFCSAESTRKGFRYYAEEYAHSEAFRYLRKSQFGGSETEENGMKKISFTKNPAPANRIDIMFVSETCFGMEFREFAFIFFRGT